MMTTTQILEQVKQKGYFHLPYPNQFKIEAEDSAFGELLFTTLVKENPQSSRLLATNQEVDLHTDHIKANYIAWQCNSQAAVGGESILVDGYKVLENATADMLKLLKHLSVKSHRLFFDDKALYPLLSDNQKVLYYASFLCEEPINCKEKQALQWFKTQLQSVAPIQLKLSEGDWLIIDNHRMLHGRKGFTKNSNRLLTRYWLSGQVI